jgi:hypothetical protein
VPITSAASIAGRAASPVASLAGVTEKRELLAQAARVFHTREQQAVEAEKYARWMQEAERTPSKQ